MPKPADHRWQARPNLIFEPGVALGVAKGKTLLTSIRADVTLFSDLDDGTSFNSTHLLEFPTSLKASQKSLGNN